MLGWRKKRKQRAQVARDGDRHDVSYRVMSRGLPGYTAITTDLSRSGVQLEASGPMAEGEELLLNLEFDREELADFSCPACVVWCKQDGARRGRFRVGMTFSPATDDERRNLSLMATVLQARTEADLRVLLEEANRLDPERAESYARVKETKPKQSANSIGAVVNHPGVYIPLTVFVEGYAWNRRRKTMTLSFLDGTETHHLYFPRCQMLTDYNCAAELMIVGMFTTLTSPAMRQMDLYGQAQESWKHYRFVAEGGIPVLDMISGPAQSYPPD